MNRNISDDQKSQFLDEIFDIWKEHPELRFMQFLQNVVSKVKGVYHMEDSTLLDALKKAYVKKDDTPQKKYVVIMTSRGGNIYFLTQDLDWERHGHFVESLSCYTFNTIFEAAQQISQLSPPETFLSFSIQEFGNFFPS